MVLVTGVCVALAALVATGAALVPRADVVATLDGHDVTRDELLFHMRRLAPTVQNELRNQYHLQGAVDWTARAGDRTALQRLEDRALDEIRRDKTTLVLAQEQGLVDSVDHDAFLAELDEENAHRADAIARGEVVYGLAEFSPDEYYSHRLTELATLLKQRLSARAGDPLWVTDAEVRQAFDADRDAWSANATTYTYRKLVVPVPDGAPSGFAEDLKRRVAAAKKLSGVTAPGSRLTTATQTGGGSAAHDQELLAVLTKLSPGQISGPIPENGQITYYELTDESVDEDAAFADYSRRIRQSLVEEKFDQLLRRRVDSVRTEVDTAAVETIDPGDVQH
ncbi:peptidylprolyl isomerase [Nonomuraea maritima]|uniref:peptidylprolyl isomerase n=1 Tax=Nonomuraea maritima TaxID=683260 RepID=UPI0037166EA9